MARVERAQRPERLPVVCFYAAPLVTACHRLSRVVSRLASKNSSVKCGLSPRHGSRGGYATPSTLTPILISSRKHRRSVWRRMLGRWDGTGTDGGTDAKSKSLGFIGLGTMGRLYTPKAPLRPDRPPSPGSMLASPITPWQAQPQLTASSSNQQQLTVTKTPASNLPVKGIGP